MVRILILLLSFSLCCCADKTEKQHEILEKKILIANFEEITLGRLVNFLNENTPLYFQVDDLGLERKVSVNMPMRSLKSKLALDLLTYQLDLHWKLQEKTVLLKKGRKEIFSKTPTKDCLSILKKNISPPDLHSGLEVSEVFQYLSDVSGYPLLLAPEAMVKNPKIKSSPEIVASQLQLKEVIELIAQLADLEYVYHDNAIIFLCKKNK